MRSASSVFSISVNPAFLIFLEILIKIHRTSEYLSPHLLRLVIRSTRSHFLSILTISLALGSNSLFAIGLGSPQSTWQFDNDLSQSNGASGATAGGWSPSYDFQPIDGENAQVLTVPALSSLQTFEFPNAIGANGGSALGKTNNWTLVFDVKFRDLSSDVALLQSNGANSDDAEIHVQGALPFTYEYFETAPLSGLPDFDALTPSSSGSLASLDLSPRQRDEHIAFRFRSRLRIVDPGNYTFYLNNSDAGRLLINGSPVVHNVLSQSPQISGSVTLTEGTHDLEIQFYGATAPPSLSLEYSPLGAAQTPIPAPLLASGTAGGLRFGAEVIADPGTIQVEKWHRLAITCEKGSGSLHCIAYLDGVQTSVGGLPSTLYKTFDGAYALGSIFHLFTDDNAETNNLCLNSVTLWPEALSSDEVAALGTSTSSGLPDLYVTNNANSGSGSLRNALTDVRPGGLIFFDLPMSGQSITLGAGGSYEISGKTLEVEARHLSSKPIIDGADSHRAFHIISNADVTLRGLVLTEGFSSGSGGAVRNEATLTLDRCIVQNSSASFGGGVINEATGVLTALDTTFSNNSANSGGGVTNAGTATFTRCTINGNSAGSAGGLEDINNTTLINCTVTGNTTNSGGGGGLSTVGTLTLRNCTVTNNDATDPFSFNGGGGVLLDFGATLNLENSIVAANTSNLAGEENIGGFGTTNTAGNNLMSGDPGLNILGDYGGYTYTMPPLIGSVSAGAGISLPSTPATDQRGLQRVVGVLDLGAVETATTPAINTFSQWSDGITNPADRTLTSDPDGDGIENLREYAFRLSPETFDASFEPLSVPVDAGGGVTHLKIVMPYRASATDLTYVLYESHDLQYYTEIYRYVASSGSETVTDPNLNVSIDTEAETITITDPVLNGTTTLWRIGIHHTP